MRLSTPGWERGAERAAHGALGVPVKEVQYYHLDQGGAVQMASRNLTVHAKVDGRPVLKHDVFVCMKRPIQ